MSTDPATVAQEPRLDGVSQAQAELANAAQEFSDIKLVVLESAELANRSANMATNAGADLKSATKEIQTAIKRQNIKFYALLALAGTLMLMGTVIFATLSITLKTRINQLDDMLASMSKRVGELNQGLEVVGSVNEGFQEMVAKQAGIASSQAQLEVRLNEIFQGTQNISEQTAKQVDAKNQVLVKQMQALESRLQSQTQTLSAMSGQVQGLRSNVATPVASSVRWRPWPNNSANSRPRRPSCKLKPRCRPRHKKRLNGKKPSRRLKPRHRQKPKNARSLFATLGRATMQCPPRAPVFSAPSPNLCS